MTVEKIELDHLSWSSVAAYLECPREWWFKYVRYSEQRKMFKSAAFDIGTLYHSAIESLYKGSSLMEVLDAFDLEKQEITGVKYHTEELNRMRQAVENYSINVLPLYKNLVTPDLIEEDVKDFYIPGVPIPIHMRIDLSTIDDRIIDHKTIGSYYYVPVAEKNKQLLLYSYRHYLKTGRQPRSIELHKAFKCDSRPIEIDSATVNFTDMLKVVDLVRNVYQMIQADIFPCYMSKACEKSRYKDEYDGLIVRNF